MPRGEARCAICLGPLDASGGCRACGSGTGVGAAPALPPADERTPPAPGDEVGGFVVQKRLDDGGMGHVLLAHDPGLDRKIALKLLHRRLVGDRRAEERFVREGRALAGVEHAHVVKVYAVGAWRGWPYIAMEYVEGTPLSALARGGRTSIAQALRIAEDVAAALAAIHAARIVHHDVKPANVVLRHRDGSACLLDFGLARSLGVTTDASGAAGTPFYMAPEQIAGRRVDQRGDVYSFGVTLFELLTGRVPHEDADGGGFFHSAMRRDAPLVSTRRPDAPHGLDALLARALARAPELRHPDGRALLAEIRELRRRLEGGDDAPAAEVREPTTAELAPPDDPGEEMPLVGRDSEYAAAARALAGVSDGRGCVVLIEGGPGSGKSRLVRDLERRARADGLVVLRCCGAEMAASPFAAVRGALLDHARAAGAAGPDAAADLLSTSSPDDAPLVPALRRLLDPNRPGADVPQDKSTLIQSALALFRVAARERPAALFIDDLHLVDEGSLDVIVALAEESASMRLALVAASRPATLLGRESALASRRPRLRAAAGKSVIELGPLSEAAVASMIHKALRVDESDARRLAPVLHKRASGNALFLVESLRLLEQEGRVADGAKGRTFRQRMSAMEIPPRMMELALRRIGVLPVEERDTLGVLSIDPEGATADFVASCRDASRLAALRVLQQLVGARGLVRHDGDRYVIAHAEIREAVYGELIPELRAAYHDHAATAISASEAAARPARLGRHLRLAGRKAEAVEPLLAAGRALLAGYSPAEGLDVLEESIMCAGAGGCPAAEVERARALEMLGELDRARADLTRLADAPGEAGVAALMNLVAFERNRGRDAAATAALERALARGCSTQQQFVLQMHKAELASRANREDEALSALARAEELAIHADTATTLRLSVGKGTVLHRLDRQGEAEAWMKQALDLAERLGRQEWAANCMHNLSVLNSDLGRRDEALRWAERAVDRAAVIGADRQQAFALSNLADLLISAMRLDDAEAALARLADPVERLDSDEARYNVFARESELALARGQFERAAAAADRAEALAGAHPRNRANIVLLKAQAELGMRRFEDALASARRARKALTEIGAEAEAEDALAHAARALRELRRPGAERDELARMESPLSFAAAVERMVESPDDIERERRRATAAALATDARLEAELIRRTSERGSSS